MRGRGTSAAWLGFERDREVARLIGQTAGAPAGTAVLAMNELLERIGPRSFGLVTPYAGDVQVIIVANHKAFGYRARARHHIDITRKYSFADVEGESSGPNGSGHSS